MPDVDEAIEACEEFSKRARNAARNITIDRPQS